jgi:predicted nuclease of predicted toxin-antitoxin system
MKFIADEDLNQRIVNGARLWQPAIDFLTAREGGLIHLPDEVVLKVAAESGRVLVTHDRNTMLGHFASSKLNQALA